MNSMFTKPRPTPRRAVRALFQAGRNATMATPLLCGVAPVLLTPGCSTTPARVVLNGSDQAELTQISSYLDGLQRFKADFTQMGPQGAAKGHVWLDRPGRLRVEYYRPGPQTILASRGRLLFVDHLTRATRELPLSRTPLDILLSSSIPFSGPVTVAALQHQPGIVLVRFLKTESPQQGALTLRFSENPIALTGVVVEDNNGQSTALDLRNLIRDPNFEPDRFIYHPDPPLPNT